LQPLASEIANLQANLSAVIDTEQQLLAQAANSEMAGEPVSVDLAQQTQRLQLARAKRAELLAGRQRDLAAIEALYISYEQCLTKLLAPPQAPAE
jgi:hypothetical protein